MPESTTYKSVTVPSTTPSSQGGVDLMNNFKALADADETESVARAALNSTLVTAISTEVTARAAVNTNLLAALATETSVRASAIITEAAVRAAAVTAEATVRANADTALAAAIGTAGLATFVNVKSFGALGDGTDQTTAIQNAIDATYNSGNGIDNHADRSSCGTIFFPRGTYVISAPLKVRSYMVLLGENRSGAFIHSTQSDIESGAIELNYSAIGYASGIEIRNMTIMTDAGYGVYVKKYPPAEKVFYYNGSTYADVTAAANADFTPFPVLAGISDALYIGLTSWNTDFQNIFLQMAANPRDILFIYEYWNGTAWTATKPNSHSAIIDLSYGSRGINFYTSIEGGDTVNLPNHASVTVNGVSKKWIRIRPLTVPALPLTGRCLSIGSPIVGIIVDNCAFSCDKEAIYLERGYSQASCFSNLGFYTSGAGCISLVGNVNRISNCDQEAGSRSGYRTPLACIMAQGIENIIENNIMEGLNAASRGYFMSGQGWYNNNHFEIPAGGIAGSSILFETFCDSFVNACGGTRANSTATRIWRCPNLHINTLSASGDIKDSLIIDNNDTVTSLTINCVHGTDDIGDPQDSRIIIKTQVSDREGQFLNFVDNPTTCNLMLNGNFERGLYGWTITPGVGVSFTTSIVPKSNGTGFRLKVQMTANTGNLDQVGNISSGSFVVPPGYSGATGFISYKGECSTSDQSILYFNGSTTLSRGLGYASAKTSINSGDSVLFFLYARGAISTATFYIEDVRIYLGWQYNYVPDTISQRNWSNGTSEIQGTAVPSTGTWKVGDKVWNTVPASGQPIGWVCTVAGTAGTWKAFGTIA